MRLKPLAQDVPTIAPGVLFEGEVRTVKRSGGPVCRIADGRSSAVSVVSQLSCPDGPYCPCRMQSCGRRRRRFGLVRRIEDGKAQWSRPLTAVVTATATDIGAQRRTSTDR